MLFSSTQAILCRESRSTRNHIWRLCWTRWKRCYPFYALFLVSTFIFLTIQFPSRRRSRKLFCLRRLGAESIFHVISAIVGNFDLRRYTKQNQYFILNIIFIYFYIRSSWLLVTDAKIKHELNASTISWYFYRFIFI